MTNKAIFQSNNGIRLVGIWHLPKKQTTKAIVLAHGITVDKDEKGIFIKLAEKLVQMGFAVFRFDFRGHGESGGKSVDMTITGELYDLEMAIEEVKKEGYTEIGLVGASFGGGISTLYFLKHQDDIDSFCLWNPVLNYDHTFLHPTLPWLTEKKDQMMKEIRENGWTTIGSRKFVVGKALFDDMATYMPFEVLKNISVPTLIVHGTKDTKVSYKDSKEYVHSLKNGQLIILDGAEHGFHKEWEAKRAIEETVRFFQKDL